MGRIISVAGKGGTGKTTLAALFVRQLIKRGHTPVLAIDADANDNLAEGLGMENLGSIAGLTDGFFKNKMDLPSGMPKEAYIEMQLNSIITEGEDADLLVMGHPEGAGCYCYVNNVLRAHMEKLTENYSYTVVDNEAGMEHVSRRTSRRIDTLLLVADFSMKAVKAAGRIREVAKELDLDVRDMGLVLNRVPADISPLTEAIEATGLKLWHTIPASDQVMGNDVVGQPVFSLPDDNPVVCAVDELVRKITGD